VLIQRVVTAAIGIPLAIFLVHRGGGLFAASVVFLLLIAWLEYRLIAKRVEAQLFDKMAVAMSLLLMAVLWLGNAYEALFIVVLFPMVLWLAVLRYGPPFRVRELAFTLLGFLYITLGFGHILALRELINPGFAGNWGINSFGEVLLWLTLFGTWTSDSAAFIVGSLVGKHKMAPHISPGKTWEGFAGGAVACVAVVCGLGIQFQLPVNSLIALGSIIAVAAPVGDLAESALKRYAGVKDSGRIFPGHGGGLDRFDSLLFVAPLGYYYALAFLLV